MCFNLRYQKVTKKWRINSSRFLAPLSATAEIFSTLRAVRGLPDDGTSKQVVAPSNFSIILRIVDSEGRLCGP
uniref:Uncharacterized protein n=1 Tax=Lepeophtheirus salmonis TaxID=72036 RepID=A0A0K2TUK1_LEPSM